MDKRKNNKYIEIYCSYAHEDESMRKELEKHLQGLKRSGVIGLWHDRYISAGTERKQEVDKHLNTAHIILLLVSPDYINSDYCYSSELVKAMARHKAGNARVIPIILRPVYWQETLFGELQALPHEGKPVTTWSDPHEAFLDIVENIKKVLAEEFHSLSKTDIKQKEEWLEEGDTNYAKKNYSGALVAYEQATRLDPYDANAFCKKGLVFQRLGQTQLALAAYELAIKYDRNCMLAYIGLGELYCSLGRYKLAEKNFDRVLRLDPNLAWVKIQRQNISGDRDTTSLGILLHERYELRDLIAVGHIASVYRAWDNRLERVVAVKMLHQAYKTDPKAVERFSREAKAAAMPHPHIVQAYDFIIGNDSCFIVMEYIHGSTLRQLLAQRKKLSIKEAVTIAHQIALGLGAIHDKEIIHRDVKPQNIYLALISDSEQYRFKSDLSGVLEEKYIVCKLGDFGIVSLYNTLNGTQITTTGMVLGTWKYCSPEQVQGYGINPSTDVYALGVVLYEMLTGHPPFVGSSALFVASQHITAEPPSLHDFDIPANLEAIVMKCLEKNPYDRFRDGHSLAQALEKFLPDRSSEYIFDDLLEREPAKPEVYSPDQSDSERVEIPVFPVPVVEKALFRDSLEQRYLVDRLLKRGQFCLIYRCFDLSFQRTVVLKLIPFSYVRIYMPATNLMTRCDHQNIMPVFDVGEIDIDGSQFSFLVMPYVPESFSTILLRDTAVNEVIDLGMQICEALLYINRLGFCHGDLTPAAILRYSSSRVGKAKVIVSNFALPSDIQYFTTWCAVGGNGFVLSDTELPYGQISEGRVGDDTRAIGLLLYQLLASRSPAATKVDPRPDGILHFRRNTPRELCEVIARAVMRIHPQHILTIESLYGELKRIAKGLEPGRLESVLK